MAAPAQAADLYVTGVLGISTGSVDTGGETIVSIAVTEADAGLLERHLAGTRSLDSRAQFESADLDLEQIFARCFDQRFSSFLRNPAMVTTMLDSLFAAGSLDKEASHGFGCR